MKLSVIIGAIPVIRKLMEQDLPVRQSYAIAKLAQRIDVESGLHNEQRRKLLEKYGEQSEDGNYKIPTDKVESCNAELNELMDVDVEIKEKIDILSTGVKLTPAEVIAIEEFMVPEEVEKE